MYNFLASVCSKCNNRCDKRERTDQSFRDLVLREKCLLRKLALKEQEIHDYAVSILYISVIVMLMFLLFCSSSAVKLLLI